MWKLLLGIQELFRVRIILPIQLNLVCALRSFSGSPTWSLIRRSTTHSALRLLL